MQCAALASTTGLRCKLEAEPGGVFCLVPDHAPGWPLAESAREAVLERAPELLEEGPGPGPGPQEPEEPPTPAPPPEPTSSEPEIEDFSEPRGQFPTGSGPGSELEEHPGPESEASARPGRGWRDVDPELFAGLEPGPQEGERENGAGGGDPDPVAGRIGPEELEAAELEGRGELPGPDPAADPTASLLERFPGPFNEYDGGKLQRAVCNRIFRRYGKDPLTPEEVEFGGEAWAAVVNYYLAQVDPNSPWGAWFLSVAVTAGPRFVPDLAGRVVGRVRSRPGGEPQARGAREAPAEERPEPAPQEEELEEGEEDLEAWRFPGGVAR